MQTAPCKVVGCRECIISYSAQIILILYWQFAELGQVRPTVNKFAAEKRCIIKISPFQSLFPMYFLASIWTVKLLVYWLFSNAKLHSTELQSPINCTALPRTNYLTHQITASNQYTAPTVGRSDVHGGRGQVAESSIPYSCIGGSAW